VKWGFPAPKNVWPRYLVVQTGDEFRAGHVQGPHAHGARIRTNSSKAASSRCYRGSALGQCFPLRCVVRWALAQESASAAAINEGVRGRLHRQRTSSAPTSPSTIVFALGAPAAYIVGRGDRAPSRASRGNRGHGPPPQAAVLPCRDRAVPEAPRIVNNVETLANLPWDRSARRRGVSPHSAPRASKGHAHVRRVQATSNKPGVYEVEYGVTTFRDLIEAPILLRGGVRNGKKLKAFIPGGASAPWVLRRAPRPAARGRPPSTRAGSMLGFRRHRRDGRRPPTSCVLAIASCAFFAKESCGKVPRPAARGTSLAREDPCKRINRRPTARPGTTSTCCSTSATNISPGNQLAAPGRPRSARSVPFRPFSPDRIPRLRPLSVHEFEGVHRRPGRDDRADERARVQGTRGRGPVA